MLTPLGVSHPVTTKAVLIAVYRLITFLVGKVEFYSGPRK